jgi:hypothetical protein
MGVKGVIYDTGDYNSVLKQMNEYYRGVTGKCPEQFILQEVD